MWELAGQAQAAVHAGLQLFQLDGHQFLLHAVRRGAADRNTHKQQLPAWRGSAAGQFCRTAPLSSTDPLGRAGLAWGVCSYHHHHTASVGLPHTPPMHTRSQQSPNWLVFDHGTSISRQ